MKLFHKIPLFFEGWLPLAPNIDVNKTDVDINIRRRLALSIEGQILESISGGGWSTILPSINKYWYQYYEEVGPWNKMH